MVSDAEMRVFVSDWERRQIEYQHGRTLIHPLKECHHNPNGQKLTYRDVGWFFLEHDRVDLASLCWGRQNVSWTNWDFAFFVTAR